MPNDYEDGRALASPISCKSILAKARLLRLPVIDNKIVIDIAGATSESSLKRGYDRKEVRPVAGTGRVRRIGAHRASRARVNAVVFVVAGSKGPSAARDTASSTAVVGASLDRRVRAVGRVVEEGTGAPGKAGREDNGHGDVGEEGERCGRCGCGGPGDGNVDGGMGFVSSANPEVRKVLYQTLDCGPNEYVFGSRLRRPRRLLDLNTQTFDWPLLS